MCVVAMKDHKHLNDIFIYQFKLSMKSCMLHPIILFIPTNYLNMKFKISLDFYKSVSLLTFLKGRKVTKKLNHDIILF